MTTEGKPWFVLVDCDEQGGEACKWKHYRCAICSHVLTSNEDAPERCPRCQAMWAVAPFTVTLQSLERATAKAQTLAALIIAHLPKPEGPEETFEWGIALALYATQFMQTSGLPHELRGLMCEAASMYIEASDQLRKRREGAH